MGKLSNRLRIGVLERDGYRCVYCGRTSADVRLEVDHVVPRAHGGADTATNLVTACFECNNGKRADAIPLPDWITPGPIVTRPSPAPRPLRERIWPVAVGTRRGWPCPDGAWDQLCVKPHSDGFLPWAVWQCRRNWYVGFYTCDLGHAWTTGYGVVAAWPDVRGFRISPHRRLPSSGYLKHHVTKHPEEVQPVVVVYPPAFPASGVPDHWALGPVTA